MASVKRRYLSSRRSDKALRQGFDVQGKALALILMRALAVCAFAVSMGPATVWGSDRDNVMFAVPDVWPWAYEDPQGRPQGSLIQVVNRLSELSGVPVEASLRPLRRALIELDSGKTNFSLLFQDPEMDARAINIGRVLQINLVLAASSDTTYPLTLSSLAGSRIGYIRGTYLGEAFQENTEVEKVPVAVISQAIEMLPLGRLSAILASDHAIMRSLHTMGIDPSELRFNVHIAEQAGALYMSRRAQRPEVAEKFRKAIAQMKSAGEFDQIFFGDTARPVFDDSGEPAPAQ